MALYDRKFESVYNFIHNNDYSLKNSAIAAYIQRTNKLPYAYIINAPTETYNTSLVLNVGNVNCKWYKWSLNGSTWTVSKNVSDALSLTLNHGINILRIKGIRADKVVQIKDTTYTILKKAFVDVTPPTATFISGIPTISPNSITNVTITVGGTDVTYYKWKIDSGAYSSELPVSSTFNLTATELINGSHTISIIGRKTNSNYQDIATTETWITDITPPIAIITRTSPVSAITNSTTATFNISGTDVTQYMYSLDGGIYSSSINISLPVELDTLADGEHVISIKGADILNNWQVAPTTNTWTVDTVPPITTYTILTGN